MHSNLFSTIRLNVSKNKIVPTIDDNTFEENVYKHINKNVVAQSAESLRLKRAIKKFMDANHNVYQVQSQQTENGLCLYLITVNFNNNKFVGEIIRFLPVQAGSKIKMKVDYSAIRDDTHPTFKYFDAKNKRGSNYMKLQFGALDNFRTVKLDCNEETLMIQIPIATEPMQDDSFESLVECIESYFDADKVLVSNVLISNENFKQNSNRI